MEKYYEKKSIRNGAYRACKCGVRLSRYNQGSVCSGCEKKNSNSSRSELLGMIDDIS